jgi:hypothetical protein
MFPRAHLTAGHAYRLDLRQQERRRHAQSADPNGGYCRL